MESTQKQAKLSLRGGDEVVGRTFVPPSFASLGFVKRMLSFDHFLMISPDGFLLSLVHTLYTPN